MLMEADGQQLGKIGEIGQRGFSQMNEMSHVVGVNRVGYYKSLCSKTNKLATGRQASWQSECNWY